MREFVVHPQLEKKLVKWSKKSTKLYEAILSKMDQILHAVSLDHYKNLKYALKDFKRVHVYSHFVLLFIYDKHADSIFFVDVEHHDKVYK